MILLSLLVLLLLCKAFKQRSLNKRISSKENKRAPCLFEKNLISLLQTVKIYYTDVISIQSQCLSLFKGFFCFSSLRYDIMFDSWFLWIILNIVQLIIMGKRVDVEEKSIKCKNGILFVGCNVFVKVG